MARSLKLMLKSLLSSRYCRENEYPYCLMKDKRFSLMKKVLETRRGELKEMGLGNRPNEAIPLSDEDINTCWETGAFGGSDPRTLEHTLYFYFSNAFGWRGRDEQTDARWGDLVLIDEDGPNEMLKWNERGSKTRKGKGKPRAFPPKLWAVEGSERCPVALYKVFRAKRTPDQKLFMTHVFLTPKFQAHNGMEFPYKNSNMSSGSIGKIMPAVKKAASLIGAIKNHSVRKTCVTKLLHSGVPPNVIMQLTGHASSDSLNSYARASEDQQRSMSDILVQGKRPFMEAPGRSLLKRSRPSAAAGSALDMVPEDLEDEDRDDEPVPAPVVQPQVQPQGPLRVPHPVVLAPGRMGGMPVEVAGMFSGAVIHGGVNIHIHYGNVASHASNTQVNLSQSPSGSPVAPHVHFD